MRLLRRFWKEESGSETVEYGLVLSLVALAAFAGIEAAGGAIATMWSGLETQLCSALFG